jgi:hypothetical protein
MSVGERCGEVNVSGAGPFIRAHVGERCVLYAGHRGTHHGSDTVPDLVATLRARLDSMTDKAARLEQECDKARAEVEQLKAERDLYIEHWRDCLRKLSAAGGEVARAETESASLRAALEEARSLIGECVELINSAYLNIPGWTDGPRNPGVVMLDASLWFSRVSALTEPGKEAGK